MSSVLASLQQADRPERNRRAFSGITRTQADRMVDRFKQLAESGDFNTVVFVGHWTPDGRMSIRHTHPIRIRDDELAGAHAHPDYEGDLPILRVPIGIDGFNLFRRCRSFGTRLEKARKKAAS
jgi:hypothetical protein